MTTEKPLIGRCAIYEDRPEGCQTYPRIDSYMPPECTYTFVGNERRGACECGISACCALPRDNGIPSAKFLHEQAGGEPCRHLIYVDGDEPVVKEAEACLMCPKDPRGAQDIYDLVGGPDD